MKKSDWADIWVEKFMEVTRLYEEKKEWALSRPVFLDKLGHAHLMLNYYNYNRKHYVIIKIIRITYLLVN